MRASMLIVTALVATALPAAWADEADKSTRQELLEKHVSERQRLRYLEESHRQAVELVARLKQGRDAGDPVYDEAETYLQRVGYDLAIQNGAVVTIEAKLKEILPIGEIAVENASNRISKLETKLQNAERNVNELEGRVQSNLTEIAQAKTDLSEARAESARRAVQIQAMNDSAKLEAPFKLVQTKLDAFKTAIENLDDAQKAADDATDMPQKDEAVKNRNGLRSARDKAWGELDKAVEALKKMLDTLGVQASRTAPADDAGTILQAGYSVNDDVVGEHVHAYSPVPLQGEVIYGGDLPPSEPIEGLVIESGPVIEPVPVAPKSPSFGPLDPPDAPAPVAPEHCVSRELPLDDPAGSWRLIGPGTRIQGLPLPGDDPSGASTEAADSTANAAAPTISGREPIVAPRKATRSIIFDCPAYFPVVRFKDRVTSYEDEGVRIAEGMVLRFDDDGWYEVEFQAHGVLTPAVLRLQIEVGIDGRPGTLTLPPISLDPARFAGLDRDGDGQVDGAGASWRVVHRGRSSRLRLAFLRRPGAGGLPALDVSRDGAARFGSGLPPTQFLPR